MNRPRQAMRIGEVASSSGLTVDAVRYYERMGLLSHDARTSGGFRTYGPQIVERLAFIRQAQSLGLRLSDIRELIGVSAGGRQNCERVRTLLIQRLADVETQMTELKSFRRTLRAALDNCDSALTAAQVDQCPVVRSLSPRSTNRKVRT
jgi:MerR family copper efflux transcriptional regulator